MSKRVSTTVYLDEEQAAELKRLSDLTRVPMAVMVRDGVELGLAKWRGLAVVQAMPRESTISAPGPSEQGRLRVGL